MPFMLDAPSYSLDEGLKYNDETFLAHPDFGKLTFGAPYGKNVVEVIGKRQVDQRYYIDIDDPLFFYIEKSSRPINVEIDGDMRAIDPSLHEQSKGVYKSGLQAVQTGIDANEQVCHFSAGQYVIDYNQYILKKVNMDNSIEMIPANWSNITVTNFRLLIEDIFPEIDFEVIFEEGRTKTNFKIKQNINAKELIFIDEMDFEGPLSMLIDNSPGNENIVQIYNTTTGETEFKIDPALTYDESLVKNSWISQYDLVGNNLHIIVDSLHLNQTSTTYPITVDPLFTAVGPIVSAFGVHGSLPSPAFCSSNLAVTFPGGSTPWDTQVAWSNFSWTCIAFGFACWESESQVWITSSCGGASPAGAPVSVWTCPGCNTAGTWAPTLGFNASGTQSLAQCYPAQCANQVMTFTINSDRIWCPTSGAFDICNYGTSSCQSMDQWSVTVQGRSVETLGNTVTGNGTQNIFDADCAGTQTLNPTPLYGVGGYTYAWSHGPTTPTAVVPGTVSTYTVDVTDACGTTVTATFDIGCPLSIDIKDFYGLKNRSYIDLNLELAEEKDISTISIMKSTDGNNWSLLESLTPTGELNYGITDKSPISGTNYYRAFFEHADGEQSKSKIIGVDFKFDYAVYPNPANDLINIVSLTESNAISQVVLVDMTGRVLLTSSKFKSTIKLNISELENGNYSALIYNNSELIDSKRISVLR